MADYDIGQTVTVTGGVEWDDRDHMYEKYELPNPYWGVIADIIPDNEAGVTLYQIRGFSTMFALEEQIIAQEKKA